VDKWTESDYPENFDKLPVERRNALLSWINQNLNPIKSFNLGHSSYGLKHLVKLPAGEDSYFDNGEFKGAMLKAGYKVKDKSELNWHFNVSERSPCFKAKR
jgi:hypothetical protein